MPTSHFKSHSKSKTVLRPTQPLLDSPDQVQSAPEVQDEASQSVAGNTPVWSQANKSLEEVARAHLAPVQAVLSEALMTGPEAVAPVEESPQVIVAQVVAPEAVAPEVVAPEAVAPEAVAPEAVAPEAVAPEAVAPEARVFKAEILVKMQPVEIVPVEAVVPQAEVLPETRQLVEEEPAEMVCIPAVAVASKPSGSVLPPQIVREAQGHRVSQQGRRQSVSRWKWHSWVGAGVGATLLMAGGAATGAYSHFAASQTIAPNVFIGNVAVGGLTPAQARGRVKSRFGAPQVSLRCGDQTVRVPLARLGAQPAIDGAVKGAYAIGRGASLPSNLLRVYGTGAGARLVLPIRWNPAQTRSALQEVNARVAIEPVDARLRAGAQGLEVVPDRVGRAVDLDAAARAIRRHRLGTAVLPIPMRRVPASVSAQSLDGQDVQLARYTTHFNAGIEGRTENIRIAARAIQNQVLMPGETFSFNACTGERTARKGYQMAHIFLRQPGQDEAEVAEGLAGGVCQVSSTLFNAVRKTNANAQVNPIKIVERSTHSLPVTYVPPGLDATVAWPGKDFKFRNITEHPVYVRTEMGRSKLSISIWNRVPRV